MQSKHGKPPGSGRLRTTGVELSREARVRLSWMDFYGQSKNVALTCRRYGISRQTFYRWLRRYSRWI
jgi:transcriptional regulator of acetoin/glycerol metabolism